MDTMTSPTTIVGNLSRDPEIRYSREGVAKTTLNVAVNRRWQDKETNEWQESTSFFDVIASSDLAENIALSLTRGMRVVVTGRLDQRSWETDEGDRRFKVEIEASDVGLSLAYATVDVHRVLRPQAVEEVQQSSSSNHLNIDAWTEDRLVEHLKTEHAMAGFKSWMALGF
jgi:single-strand DNA-binding protein